MSEPQASPPGDNEPTTEIDPASQMSTTSETETAPSTSIEFDSLSNGLVAARIADDFRGGNILLIDMRPITPITDFFVIATATSSRQMRAMADEVDIVMKNRGNTKIGAEGEGDTLWMLRDYGDVVLHIFNPTGRELYALEDLWGDAKRIPWQE